MELQPDKKSLIELAHYKMPFGKYKGWYVIDLPERYLVWFRQKGFPTGKLGTILQSVLEIKINELEGMVKRIQKDFPKETR